MTEPQVTHFADDATLAHIGRLEYALAAAQGEVNRLAHEVAELRAERATNPQSTKPFRELREAMSPESQERAARMTAELLEPPLSDGGDLREAIARALEWESSMYAENGMRQGAEALDYAAQVVREFKRAEPPTNVTGTARPVLEHTAFCASNDGRPCSCGAGDIPFPARGS